MTIPGQWWGIYKATSNETAVYHRSNDANVGKKLVLSNAFKLTYSSRVTHLIPVYDLHKLTFNTCDRFNRALHDSSFPHKKGGCNVLGDLGVQHDFLLSCILQNTFGCLNDLTRGEAQERSYLEKCSELADTLFIYASNLP